MIVSETARKRSTPNAGDPFRMRDKLPLATGCGKCGAVYFRGKWTYRKTTGKSSFRMSLCPACRREKEHMPAGLVGIRGGFYKTHKEEVHNRIHNIEKKEVNSHPMERIMSSDNFNDGLIITTTGIHLARRIGDGLQKSFKGMLSCTYGPGEEKVRIDWVR